MATTYLTGSSRPHSRPLESTEKRRRLGLPLAKPTRRTKRRRKQVDKRADETTRHTLTVYSNTNHTAHKANEDHQTQDILGIPETRKREHLHAYKIDTYVHILWVHTHGMSPLWLCTWNNISSVNCLLIIKYLTNSLLSCVKVAIHVAIWSHTI